MYYKRHKGKGCRKSLHSTIGPRLRLSDRPILINSRMLLILYHYWHSVLPVGINTHYSTIIG